MLKYVIFLIGILSIPHFYAQNPQELLTKIYFESELPLIDSNGFTFSETYFNSGSVWTVDSLFFPGKCGVS